MDNYTDLFSHKFISQRVEFIEDVGVVDIKKDDIRKKLFEYLDKKGDSYYQSLLIDCAIDREIFDHQLVQLIQGQILKKKHFFIKLSALNYLFQARSVIPDIDGLVRKLNGFLIKKHELLLVKNEVVLLLILLDNQNSECYIDKLKRSLRKTTNYNSHIRVFNTIMDYETLSSRLKNHISELLEISQAKKFGKAVSSKITEVRSFHKEFAMQQ